MSESNQSPRLPSRSPPPCTLFVNRESRHETLRHYKPILSDDPEVQQKALYIDPKVDTLVLQACHLSRGLLRAKFSHQSHVSIEEFKSLAFYPVPFDSFYPIMHKMMKFIRLIEIDPTYVYYKLAWESFTGIDDLRFIIDLERSNSNVGSATELAIYIAEIRKQFKEAQLISGSSMVGCKIPNVAFELVGLPDARAYHEGWGESELDELRSQAFD